MINGQGLSLTFAQPARWPARQLPDRWGQARFELKREVQYITHRCARNEWSDCGLLMVFSSLGHSMVQTPYCITIADVSSYEKG